jgi:hypothetical protein
MWNTWLLYRFVLQSLNENERSLQALQLSGDALKDLGYIINLVPCAPDLLNQGESSTD